MSNQAIVSGRTPWRKLSPGDEDQILAIYENSRTPVPKIGKQFGVTKPTVYSSIERARARRDALRSQQQQGGAADGTNPINQFSPSGDAA